MKKPRYNPVRSVIRKLQGIKSDPLKVAYGFAFGVFMASTPFIGFKWLLALPVVMLARWSKMACMVGILQVNYLTGPFFYTVAYVVGKEVCGFENALEWPGRLSFQALADIFTSNAEVFVSLLVGGMILGIPMAVGSWYLARSVLQWKFKPQIT